MHRLTIIAPVAGICSFGLGLYAAFERGAYVVAAAFFVVFVIFAFLFVRLRKAQVGTPSIPSQSQRSGAHSTNYQAGRDINVSGGKDGR